MACLAGVTHWANSMRMQIQATNNCIRSLRERGWLVTVDTSTSKELAASTSWFCDTNIAIRNISGNIDQEELDLLCGIKFKHSLKIPNTNCDNAILDKICGNPNIKQLDISRNKVTGLGLKHVTRIPSIESLDISFTSISSEDMQVIAEMHDLNQLSIDGKQLSGCGLKYVMLNLNISLLTLSGKGIDNQVMHDICQHGHIKNIRLFDTLVTIDSINKMMAINSSCNIFDLSSH